MNPRVKKVKPLKDYTLHLTFENGEEKIFDVKPYLGFGVFGKLKDLESFNSVQACFGSIRWNNDVDIDPDTLYLESKPLHDMPIAAEQPPEYKKR